LSHPIGVAGVRDPFSLGPPILRAEKRGAEPGTLASVSHWWPPATHIHTHRSVCVSRLLFAVAPSGRLFQLLCFIFTFLCVIFPFLFSWFFFII
jgi:hypothetical protein